MLGFPSQFTQFLVQLGLHGAGLYSYLWHWWEILVTVNISVSWPVGLNLKFVLVNHRESHWNEDFDSGGRGGTCISHNLLGDTYRLWCITYLTGWVVRPWIQVAFCIILPSTHGWLPPPRRYFTSFTVWLVLHLFDSLEIFKCHPH